MNRYNQSLINKEFNTYEVYKGRRKKPIIYSDDILTFDIETSSAWMDKDRLIPYEPGHDAKYWNSLDKYSLPYIWQFSFNDEVYYGRDIRTFEHVLEDLPKDVEFVIYVHNLSYEFVFLTNFLTPEKVFATSPHKIIYCTFKGYKNITFRCSYFLTNLSLDQWGKQLGVKKLTGELDYRILRSPNTPLFDYELDYCERDCVVVYEGIKDHLKRYVHVKDIPLTSTGKVRGAYKKLVTGDDEYMKNVKKTIPKDAEFYKLLKYRLFQGGYTHGSRQFLGKKCGKGHHADIRSSYPAVMCAYKFPYGKFAYIGKRLPDPDQFEDRAYIIKVKFMGLICKSWNSYLSSSKCAGKGFITDNGRVLKAEELHTVLTEQDFITVCNNYEWDEIESEGTYYCRKKYLPKVFIDFVLNLYHDKTALKGVDPEKYAISKQYINSMFGMCVTSLIQSLVIYDHESGNWNVEELTKDLVELELDKLRMFWNKKYFLSYQVGVWITAYARRRLWQLIEFIDDDLFYTDTDSIFYRGEHDFSWFNEDITERLKKMSKEVGCDFNLTHPKTVKGEEQPLGTLDFEDDFDDFKTLGAKKYCEKRDGKLYITISGINKGASACLNSLDDFKKGFVFDKDDPSVHKLEHSYVYDMQPVKWIDNFVSYGITKGIVMRPTGYKLSMPNVEDKLEQFMKGEFLLNEKFYKRKRGFFK